MTEMKYELILNTISKFISLDEFEKEYFISIIKFKSLKKDEFLICEGDICRNEYFVNRGCLKSYCLDEEGIAHILDFSIEGWWAEDLHSFFTDAPSSTNIQAIENTEVIVLNKIDVEKLYRKIPKFEKFFRLSFQNAYIAQRERIIANLSISAEHRYKIFLQKYPYSQDRFLQKDIASYLGITPQFLSSLKNKPQS